MGMQARAGFLEGINRGKGRRLAGPVTGPGSIRMHVFGAMYLMASGTSPANEC